MAMIMYQMLRDERLAEATRRERERADELTRQEREAARQERDAERHQRERAAMMELMTTQAAEDREIRNRMVSLLESLNQRLSQGGLPVASPSTEISQST